MKKIYIIFLLLICIIAFLIINKITIKIKNYNACCNYITKYITKDCIRNSHNQIYISSRGLKKALRTDIQNFDFFEDYKNDYCKIKAVDFDTLSMQEKLYYIDKFSLTK